MVPGCGRGRLVQFVLDAVEALSEEAAEGEAASPPTDGAGTAKRARVAPLQKVHVYAVDANPIAVAQCRSRFASERRVSVVGPLALAPGMGPGDVPAALTPALGKCDLIVSELLGSFADNEFMCEKCTASRGAWWLVAWVLNLPVAVYLCICVCALRLCVACGRCAVTQTLRRLFLKGSGGVLVPSDFTCFAAPTHCPRAHALLQSLGRSSDQPYIMSLTDGDVVWGPLQPLWSHAPTHRPRRRFEGTLTAQLSQPLAASSAAALAALASEAAASRSTAEGGPVLAPSDEATVDGVVGFFGSTLYGALHVDSRPQLHAATSTSGGSEVGAGRNAMHWEAFYFPLKEPLTLPRGALLTCTVAQVTCPAAEGSSATSDAAVLQPDDDGDEYVAAASDEMWYEWKVEALPAAVPATADAAAADAAAAVVSPVAVPVGAASSEAASAGSSAAGRRGGGRQHSIKLGSDFVPKGSDIPAEDGGARLQLAMLRQNAERWRHSYLPAAAPDPGGRSEGAAGE